MRKLNNKLNKFAWLALQVALLGAALLTTAMPVAASPQISKMEMLEDSTRSMTLNQAIQEGSWKTVPSKVFSSGYSQSAFWVRLTLQSPEKQEVILTILPSFLDDLRFYIPPGLLSENTEQKTRFENGWLMLQQGDNYPDSERSFVWRSFNTALQLHAQKDETIYLRLQTGSTTLIHPQIWTTGAFSKYENIELLIFGMVFGCVLIYSLLSLSLFILLRDRIFAYYLSYALTCSCWYVSVNGFLSLYFLRENPILASNLLGFFACLVFASSAMFMKSVIGIASLYPRIDRILGLTIFAQAILALPSLYGWYPYFVSYLMWGTLFQWVVFAGICLRQILKNATVNRYATFTYIVIIVCNSFMILTFLSRLIPQVLTSYMLQIMTFIDLTVLLPSILIHFGNIKKSQQNAEIASTLVHARLDLEKEARETQRQWVSIITHEIKTPLTIIDASRQTIETISENDLIRQRTEKIERATQRIDALVQSFLSDDEIAQRHKHLIREKIDIPQLAIHLRDQLHGDIADRFSLDIADQLSAQTGSLTIDLELIAIALRNLVTNGLQHGSTGGNVVLSIENHTHGSRAGIAFCVMSNGPPITAAAQERLFHRFHRDGDHAGHGIGLWASREIARSHGGDAWYENKKIGNNCFCIWLPYDGRNS